MRGIFTSRRKSLLALAGLVAVAAMLVGTLGGCTGGTTTPTATSGGGAEKLKIALLLPETKTARYETQDKPLFEKKVKELAPDAEIIYSNANQDANEQQSQACLLYTSPSPRDRTRSRMPSSA
jgi:D-xylose transport system substrate-binding protein